MKGREVMFPSINVKETGINLRRIMDKRGYTVKDVQDRRVYAYYEKLNQRFVA